MPVPENTTLQVQINAGPIVTGGLTVAHTDTIDLSVDNTAGIQKYRWELYEYPKGLTLADIGSPAGWSLDGATGIIFSTDPVPTQFSVPASTTLWGKYFLRLIVNDGLRAGVKAADLIDEDTALEIVSTNLGLHDIGFRETTQFGGVRQWIDALKDDLRALDNISISGLTLPADPADNGKVAIANAGNFTYLGGGAVGHVLSWDGSSWISAAPGALVLGWPDVLSDNPNSGANDPSIDAGRHLQFVATAYAQWAGQIDLRTNFWGTIIETVGGSAHVNVTTSHRADSTQNGIGFGTDIEGGTAGNGFRTINETLATAIADRQHSPAFTMIGSGWFTDTMAAYQGFGGWRWTATNTTTGAPQYGAIEWRIGQVGDGFSAVVFRYAAPNAEPYIAILDSSAQSAGVGRGIRTGRDFQIVTRDSVGGGGGDTQILGMNVGILGADDQILGMKLGSPGWGWFVDMLGTPVPRMVLGENQWGLFSADGTVGIAQVDNDVALFSGFDGDDWAGIIAFDPQTNPNGERVDLAFEDSSAGLSVVTETPATAILQQYSRYVVWSAGQWSTDGTPQSFDNTWGWQLRGESHDHTVLPDPQGRLVLRQNHRDVGLGIDIYQIRHELDATDTPHTYLEGPPTETSFNFEVKGADGLAGNDFGRDLWLFGGRAQGTGTGGQVFAGGGFGATLLDEGKWLFVRHNDVDETIDLDATTGVGLVNFTNATGPSAQQFSSAFALSGAAWNTDAGGSSEQTTWGQQLRFRSFDGTSVWDFGSWTLRAEGNAVQHDVIGISAFGTPGAAAMGSVLLHRGADDQAAIVYRGTDAISADTLGGSAGVQAGFSTGTANGPSAFLLGGSSTGSGEQGPVFIYGHNTYLMPAIAGGDGGMQGGIVIEEAVVVPSTDPTASPFRIFQYVDPADGLLKYRDSSGVTHTL